MSRPTEEEALARWLATGYGLPPVECRLLRAYTNDVYTVTSSAGGGGGGRFVLKVYGAGWRTEAEVRYEAALIRHLHDRGLATPAPLPSLDGDVVTGVETPDGSRRTAVLFPHAPGEKPRPPFAPALYAAFGRAIARMHTLSDDFTTEYARPILDLRALVDAPLALTLPLLEAAEDRRFLVELSDRVKREIGARADEMDAGPIHGDATLDNLHVTDDGEIVLYDFDSGGPGWRAADLQGWAAQSPRYQSVWDAFLGGYASVRPVGRADLAAAPLLTLAEDIRGLRIDLENRVLRKGLGETRAYLSEQMARLRGRGAALLPA